MFNFRCKVCSLYLYSPCKGSAYTRVGLYASIYDTLRYFSSPTKGSRHMSGFDRQKKLQYVSMQSFFSLCELLLWITLWKRIHCQDFTGWIFDNIFLVVPIFFQFLTKKNYHFLVISFYRNIFLSQYCLSKLLVWQEPKAGF
jgi:hypothetical protein